VKEGLGEHNKPIQLCYYERLGYSNDTLGALGHSNDGLGVLGEQRVSVAHVRKGYQTLNLGNTAQYIPTRKCDTTRIKKPDYIEVKK
jgi:hypothetical protein